MKNKTVLITGTSKGIGYEIAMEALRQEAVVVGLARSLPAIDHKNYHHVQIDLVGETDFTPVINTVKRLNGLDAVINNAGLLVNRPFHELNREEWQAMMDVNVISPAIMLKELYEHTVIQKGAHVVNLSSMGGYQGSVKFPGLSGYSASKGALSILTESLAAEWIDEGIVVNALCLGGVETDMYRSAFPEAPAGVSPEDMARYIINFTFHSAGLVNGKVLPISSSTP